MRNYTGTAIMLAGTMALAVGCYSLSLRVSGERAAVERLKGKLVADNRAIRTLEAELRTRARMPELQRWNDQVASMQMKAPVAAQYLHGAVQLASFTGKALGEAGKPAGDGAATLHYAVGGEAPQAAPAPVVLDRPLVRAAYVVPAHAPRPASADLAALIDDSIDSAEQGANRTISDR